jgi:pimeloyl-ACP methyl ester carboxylesterase
MRFVLIHGAFIAASCWSEVARELCAGGNEVFYPALTGVAEQKHQLSESVDLDTHIADIQNLIRAENLDDVVLLGHSHGGMAITGVAERCPGKVRMLVYMDAVIPEHGQSFFDVCHPMVGEALKASVKDGWRVELPDGWSAASYGIDDPEQQRRLEADVTPQPLHIFDQPLNAPMNMAKDVPRAFVYCTDPRTAPYFAANAEKAEREGILLREIEAVHLAMVTRPAEVAKILIELGRNQFHY